MTKDDQSSTNLALTQGESLPSLIDRAASALISARSSAEVLEARDMARRAYDVAKSAGRMAKAKAAHDVVIAAVYRAQADAAVIEALAKVRLADEYDAAQKRGEVAKLGDNLPRVVDDNSKATAADIGLRRDEIHDARRLRDAEAAEPGRIEAAAAALVTRGKEPTKAALRREVLGGAEEAARPDPHATARKGLSGMTREGLEDEVIGLREENTELRARVKKQTGDIADLKKELKDFESEDGGEVIRRLQAEIKNISSARFRAEEKAAGWLRQVNALKNRVEQLEKEARAMEIPLN
ncbi:MAG: hypothetical protein OEZ19_10215 [Paracoccaceae bacterium]|nr:hypothetical protein [Paracoccaceae bacterium]